MIDRFQKVHWFWRSYGTAALGRLIIQRFIKKVPSGATKATEVVLAHSIDIKTSSSENLKSIIENRFSALTPLRTFYLDDPQRKRVTIITDSVGSSSLFGGVGTALIFAAILANRLGANLRIVTRTERASPENISNILDLYDIKLERDMQFKFAPFYDRNYEVDVAKNDLFITTSWWTTAATLPSVAVEQIIYLLQEDERMFYPFGDDRFRCDAILKNKELRYLINTKLLFDHFLSDGYENIAARGFWFEPAFPKKIFHPRHEKNGEKFKFFFYARPNNPRNLFYLGIEVIEQAILEGILDTNSWEIYLVGKDIPAVTFSGNYVPIKCENFSWSEYADLAGTIDVGLSLMSTPHPSYPPLDLAASGAVVVTNQFGEKQDLSNYSPNLICAELNRDALVIAIQQAVEISRNDAERRVNYESNGLLTEWTGAFEEVIARLEGNA